MMTDADQLVDLYDRRQRELDFAQAQMIYCNLSAKWACTQEYRVGRDLDVAESRLIQLFMEDGWHFSSTNRVMNLAWDAYRHYLLFHHAKQS